MNYIDILIFNKITKSRISPIIVIENTITIFSLKSLN